PRLSIVERNAVVSSSGGAVVVDPRGQGVELQVGAGGDQGGVGGVADGRVAVAVGQRSEQQVDAGWLQLFQDSDRTGGGCADDPGRGDPSRVVLALEREAVHAVAIGSAVGIAVDA